jgi:hypothetical protein
MAFAQPVALHQADYSRPSKRRRRTFGGCLTRLLVVFVLLLAVLAGGWFLLARPYLHNIAQTQLDQTLSAAASEILLFQAALPAGKVTIPATETQLNTYLNGHDTDVVQNLHMTITASGLQLDFSVYGYSSTITAVPVVSGGALQMSNVQIAGVLGLIMSSDELSTDLNSQLQSLGQKMKRTVDSVQLKAQEMDISLH